MISLSSRARSAAFRVWPFSPGWYGRRFANRFSKPLSCTFDLETWISYSAELIKSTIGWSFIAQQKVASMELGNVKTSQRQKNTPPITTFAWGGEGRPHRFLHCQLDCQRPRERKLAM